MKDQKLLLLLLLPIVIIVIFWSMSQKEHLTEITSPLIDAVYYNRKEEVKSLIENGADINSKNKGGYTALHIAARKGRYEIAEYLIDNRANIEYNNTDALQIYSGTDDSRGTALHGACLYGYPNIVELLIKNGANVHAVGQNNDTALHRALQKYKSSQLECVKILIEHQANVNAADKYGTTPLHTAALYIKDLAKLKTVSQILIDNGADVNTKRKSGTTPLNHAAGQIHANAIELVEFYVSNGASLHNATGTHGSTMLHTAISHGKYKLVVYLLDNGLSVNAMDSNGETPIYKIFQNSKITSTTDKLDFIQLLMDSDANVNVQNHLGNTPLHYASDIEVAKLFIKSGANINITNNVNEGALRGYTDENKVRLNVWSEECQESLNDLETNYLGEISDLKSDFQSDLLERDGKINTITSQRNDTFASLKDMKYTQFTNANKKSHDLFQKLKEYQRKYTSYKKANKWLFLILFLLIIILSIIKVKKSELLNIYSNSTNLTDMWSSFFPKRNWNYKVFSRRT